MADQNGNPEGTVESVTGVVIDVAFPEPAAGDLHGAQDRDRA